MFPIFQWQLAHGRVLELGAEAKLMGVLNVTTDSFSDGGNYLKSEDALHRAAQMVADGVDIIDVGGESTRPGAEIVDAQEEQDRILPIISALSQRGDVLISVDTYRAETAKLAIEAGAHIINDVWGLQKDTQMANIAAQTGAGLVIMHTGRDREKLVEVIEDQFHFLSHSLEIADAAGVSRKQIVLDPGFGFAKETTEENLELMARFRRLSKLGQPFLIGTSRKRFIGAITGREAAGRDAGTAATSVIMRLQGADIFRVHDVAMNRDALRFADEMLSRGLIAQEK